MKNQFLMSALLSVAYFVARAFNGSRISHALGAKSGTVTAPSGSDAVIKALGDAAPVTNTLAGIARDALAAATGNKIAIINVANRTVTIVPAGTNIAAVTGATGFNLAGTLTFDDPTKATGPMSLANEDANLGPIASAIIGAAKPSFSVESVANKIEDAINDAVIDISGVIVVDQANANVKIYEASVAQVEAVLPAALLAEDAHFVQTLTPSSGRQFGE